MPLKEWKFQKDGFTFNLNIVDTDSLIKPSATGHKRPRYAPPPVRLTRENTGPLMVTTPPIYNRFGVLIGPVGVR